LLEDAVQQRRLAAERAGRRVPDQVPDAMLGPDRAQLPQRAQRLPREQRVAAALRVHVGGQPLVRAAGQVRGDQGGGVGRIQRAEIDHGAEPGVDQPADSGGEAVAGQPLVQPGADDQEKRELGQVPGGQRQGGQGLVIRQVRIIQGDDRGPVPAQAAEELGREQVGRLKPRALVRSGPLAEHRGVQGQQQVSEDRLAGVIEVRGRHGREQVPQARVGDAVVVVLGLAAQHEAVMSRGAVQQFLDQAGFPDPGLAGDEAGAAGAAQGALQVVQQLGERELPAHGSCLRGRPRGITGVSSLTIGSRSRPGEMRPER
jgi:hypothetical protein